MDFISKNLQIIADCINNNTYQNVETDRFELKDLSKGWGEDWYKSVCSFLNTNGGVIVIGISERGRSNPAHYSFTGYVNSPSNENHLKQDLPKEYFTDSDGTPRDVTRYIRFEIRDFLDGQVMVVYVEELPDDEKYVFYKGTAYKRKITGDHALTPNEVEVYEELKIDIIKSQELEIIKNASLDLLNINTLNNYITEFNRGKKRGETYKANLKQAKTFLEHESFIRDNQPTLLGMLVCGNHVESYIQGKCEADCYVISPFKAAESREIITDNIIELISRSNNFVWRNIQVGVLYANGGTAEPEYPEELIRECINNAFAHRNYKTDRFVIIEIRPNESLMIRNPGNFQRRQRIHIDTDFGKIRRIVPIQVSRNPKLTHLLKSFNYWEGKGRGLTSLIDACLDNIIDVPYYILTQDEIKLFIPKGKVCDDAMNQWFKSFSGYLLRKLDRELSEEEKIMLSFFRKSEDLNRLEQYTILLTMDNNHKEVIAFLEEKNLIFKDPQSPEIYPIYRIDRTLLKTHFNDELKEIFGGDWINFKSDYQETLNAIYAHQTYGDSSESISANSIGTFMYSLKHKEVTDLNDYENYKRKVRNLFNQLEQKQLIVRKDGKTKEEGGKPDFIINDKYASLFNN